MTRRGLGDGKLRRAIAWRGDWPCWRGLEPANAPSGLPPSRVTGPSWCGVDGRGVADPAAAPSEARPRNAVICWRALGRSPDWGRAHVLRVVPTAGERAARAGPRQARHEGERQSFSATAPPLFDFRAVSRFAEGAVESLVWRATSAWRWAAGMGLAGTTGCTDDRRARGPRATSDFCTSTSPGY